MAPDPGSHLRDVTIRSISPLMATSDSVPTRSNSQPVRRPPVVAAMTQWEFALQSVSHLAVVFALSLALILILAHQVAPLG